jgi:AraC-like DNA-binding protein
MPLICTVQAPECGMPQPNFLTVMPRTSRNTHWSRVSPSTSIARSTPLTLRVAAIATSGPFVQRPSRRVAGSAVIGSLLSPACGRAVAVFCAAGLEPKSDRIQRALAYAKRNLDKPLTVRQLAEAAHLSQRQFSRAFRAETGQSPAEGVENLRVEAARLMTEQSRHPIDVIARQTGFADRDRMRRAFVRAFGQPPRAIRRNTRLASRALGPCGSLAEVAGDQDQVISRSARRSA